MEEFFGNLLGKECYRELILSKNFFHGPCLALLLSKFLGFAIILGSVGLKVPQIIKILNAKSAQGLALSSVLLELIGYLFTMAYSFRKGFPFSTYGETTFISIQNLVILVLIFWYGGGLSPQFFLLIGSYVSLVYLFIGNPGDLLPTTIVASLQSLNIPIFIAARIPQIWANYSAKSTGQLAFATWLLNFVGASVRVFTTIQEVRDPLLLSGFILAVFLNGTILGQIFYYGGGKPAPPAPGKKKQH